MKQPLHFHMKTHIKHIRLNTVGNKNLLHEVYIDGEWFWNNEKEIDTKSTSDTKNWEQNFGTYI